jgi:hypothetical protein
MRDTYNFVLALLYRAQIRGWRFLDLGLTFDDFVFKISDLFDTFFLLLFQGGEFTDNILGLSVLNTEAHE